MDRTTPNARPLRSPTFGSSVLLNVVIFITTIHGIERQSLHRYSFGILRIAWLQGNEVSIIRYLRCRYKSTFEANQIHPEPLRYCRRVVRHCAVLMKLIRHQKETWPVDTNLYESRSPVHPCEQRIPQAEETLASLLLSPML